MKKHTKMNMSNLSFLDDFKLAQNDEERYLVLADI